MINPSFYEYKLSMSWGMFIVYSISTVDRLIETQSITDLHILWQDSIFGICLGQNTKSLGYQLLHGILKSSQYYKVEMSKDSNCIISFLDLRLFLFFMSWAASSKKSSNPFSVDLERGSSKLKFFIRLEFFAIFGRLGFLKRSSFFRSLWSSSDICFFVSITSLEKDDRIAAVFCGGKSLE